MTLGQTVWTNAILAFYSELPDLRLAGRRLRSAQKLLLHFCHPRSAVENLRPN